MHRIFLGKDEQHMVTNVLNFHLPDELNAIAPPERRGVRRDHVKMMVLNKKNGKIDHSLFFRLDQYLNKDDLIILNSSRTVPADLQGICERTQKQVGIRLAHQKNPSLWEALIIGDHLKKGEKVKFNSKLEATVTHSDPNQPFSILQFNMCCSDLYNQIYQIGEPVRYEYTKEAWSLDYYQTVFATTPGSVEMPSAGRAFSWELLFRLQKKGVKIAYLQLHTGLSYLLDDRWHLGPLNNFEKYVINEATVEAIKKTKKNNGRVIAVGTTVVRALESAVDKYGEITEKDGWTNLYIAADTKLQVADGLITGFHEPEASHLDLLTAFVNPKHLYHAYQEALSHKYLWHEFGDMNLII